MKILFKLAACGFVLTALVHGLALTGVSIHHGFLVGLFFLLFVIWIPACAVYFQVSRYAGRIRAQGIILSACPAWMRYGLYVVVGYGLLNTSLLEIIPDRAEKLADSSDLSEMRIFSSFLTAFYGVAIAILYSKIHAPQLFHARKCPNGHDVSPTAHLCPECGYEFPQDTAAF